MWTAAALGLAVAAGAAATVRYFAHAPAHAQEIRLQINTGAGDPNFFAISPDGTRVVYQGTAQGSLQLLVRSLQTETPQALAGTEGASNPFWSADSRLIGFFSDRKLRRLDLAGGATQTIADAPSFRGGAWNNDKVIIIGSTSGPLLRVSAAGGQPLAATTMTPPQTSHRYPQFLPDGRHFFFYVTVRGMRALPRRSGCEGDATAP